MACMFRSNYGSFTWSPTARMYPFELARNELWTVSSSREDVDGNRILSQFSTWRNLYARRSQSMFEDLQDRAAHLMGNIWNYVFRNGGYQLLWSYLRSKKNRINTNKWWFSSFTVDRRRFISHSIREARWFEESLFFLSNRNINIFDCLCLPKNTNGCTFIWLTDMRCGHWITDTHTHTHMHALRVKTKHSIWYRKHLKWN